VKKGLVSLVLLLGAAALCAQVLPQTFRLQAIEGVRQTNPLFQTQCTPAWHAPNDSASAIDSSQTLTQNVAFSLSLTSRCSVDADAGCPAGTIAFEDVDFDYPTGISLAGASGPVSGTPTVIETQTPTLACTFTAPNYQTFANQQFTFTVINPDSQAPAAPTNVVFAPLSSSSLQLSSSVCTDAGGVLSYDFSRSGDQTTCGSADNNPLTNATPTATYTGLAASTTYWGKMRCRDNSSNVSAWSACVSGTTSAGGGTPLAFNNGFENYAAGTNLITALPDALYTDSTDGSVTLESSNAQALEGANSLHTRIVKSGTTNFRSEVRIKSSTDNVTMAGSDDYWAGVAIRIPAAASLVTGSVMFQWHTVGPCNCSPVIGLRIRNGNWEQTQEGTSSNTNVTLAAVTADVWHRWVFRIRWRTDTTGLIQVWHNGVLVVNRNNDQTGGTGETQLPYLKMGDYASLWKFVGNADLTGTVKEAYHDSLRICYGAACAYGDVVPP